MSLDTNALNQMLKEIIERKHRELQLGQQYNDIFSKIKDFEANAIGQIGEEFARTILQNITSIEQNPTQTIHNEYDIKTQNGIKIEIKTARKGKNNDTFQFNGIEPRRNYQYLLCIGICLDKVVYRLFKHEDIVYLHDTRKFYIQQNNFKKQLVKMNPDNLVNYKLTTNLKEIDKTIE